MVASRTTLLKHDASFGVFDGLAFVFKLIVDCVLVEEQSILFVFFKRLAFMRQCTNTG